MDPVVSPTHNRGENGMREYELAGNNDDIGRQNAVCLKQSGYSPRPATAEQLRFALACEAVVEEHAPWLIEEI